MNTRTKFSRVGRALPATGLSNIAGPERRAVPALRVTSAFGDISVPQEGQ